MFNFLLIPLDFAYLTFDLWRIWLNASAHGATGFTQKKQACIFCQHQDAGDAPRKAPPGVRKYRNRWMIHWVQPCLMARKRSKYEMSGNLSDSTLKRLAESSTDTAPTVHSLCMQDHMFVTYSRRLPLLTLLATAIWIALFLGIFQLVIF